MAHRSRGCLRCRQRRVKCDRRRPSCQRCVARDELCVGYRDDADLMFKDETEKTVIKSQTASISTSASGSASTSATASTSTGSSSSPRSQRTRSRSLERPSPFHQALYPSSIQAPSALPWLKFPSPPSASSTDSHAVSRFMDKYVVYPCSESSFPGFLEHLPSLFVDVNVEGRYALRWAVQAAAFADLSREQSSQALAVKAFDCYGLALAALGESLAEKGKEPDDFDMMTVVVLDIFETLFIPEAVSPGTHAQGMAHILRLRGHGQFHDPRGWGLFRLAHHRLQKQQLAKQLDPLPESKEWLDTLNEQVSFVRLEKDSLDISTVCQKARSSIQCLQNDSLSYEEVAHLVEEMMRLDDESARWRQRPEWAFRTLSRSELKGDPVLIPQLPATIQLHRDVWMAYEWCYHRTARIILHQRLLTFLRTASSNTIAKTPEAATKMARWEVSSILTIQTLVDEVLATVPQFFGDVDHLGRCLDNRSETPRCQAIGAYLLLWPMKIIKSPEGMSTHAQKDAALTVFERIRECTGMKLSLGDLSMIY
ncbi:hypothetical protein G7046_g5205 [Stylonectria norvegica]|nr:hypothetical protein G7046_g5205 [Stylonectria norvegica]